MRTNNVRASADALISKLTTFIAVLTLLGKHDQSLKSHSEAHHHDTPAEQGYGAAPINPTPKHNHPTEGEHRSNAEAHWRKQIFLERIALTLSAVAAGAAIVAGVGAWYTYGQGRKAVIEARRQADEATQQANIAGDTETRQLRAYVGISPTSDMPVVDRSFPLIFKATIRNSGLTPARDIRIFLTYKVAPVGAQEGAPADWTETDPLRHLGSLFPVTDRVYTGTFSKVAEADVTSVASGSATIVVYGTVWYNDIFGDGRYTDFCWFYSPENFQRATVSFCEGHSTSD